MNKLPNLPNEILNIIFSYVPRQKYIKDIKEEPYKRMFKLTNTTQTKDYNKILGLLLRFNTIDLNILPLTKIEKSYIKSSVKQFEQKELKNYYVLTNKNFYIDAENGGVILQSNENLNSMSLINLKVNAELKGLKQARNQERETLIDFLLTKL